MNGKTILGLVAIVGFAKLVFGGHRHGMRSRERGDWQERVATFHRELHRRDAQAGAGATTDPGATAPAPASGV